jgi:hypothetical protein
MTGYLDLNMINGFRPEEDVELPSGAGKVRIRGVDRKTAVTMAGIEDASELDVLALVAGMVTPALSEDAARAWCENGGAADVQAVVQRISKLSSLDDNAPKEPISRSRRTRR